MDGEYAQKLIAFLKEKGFVPPQEGRKRVNPPKPKNEPKRMKQANRRNLWG